MPCLSTEELAALFDCVLPLRQSEELRAHVAECPKCANEIKVLSRMLECRDQDASPGVGLLERARELARKPIDRSQVDRDRAKCQPAVSPRGKRTAPKSK